MISCRLIHIKDVCIYCFLKVLNQRFRTALLHLIQKMCLICLNEWHFWEKRVMGI